MRNLQPLHFSYISGVINEFHETLEQAIEKASEPENGCWFNNSWMQATTGTYEIGELELHGNVAMAIDHTGRYESIADVSQIPWVEWGDPATQRSYKSSKQEQLALDIASVVLGLVSAKIFGIVLLFLTR